MHYMKHERGRYGHRTITLGRSLTLPRPEACSCDQCGPSRRTVSLVDYAANCAVWTFSRLVLTSRSRTIEYRASRVAARLSSLDVVETITDPREAARAIHRVRRETDAARVVAMTRLTGRPSLLVDPASIACRGCEHGCMDCDQFDYERCDRCGYHARTTDLEYDNGGREKQCWDCRID